MLPCPALTLSVPYLAQFRQLMEGIAFCHSRYIVHRDMKLVHLHYMPAKCHLDKISS